MTTNFRVRIRREHDSDKRENPTRTRPKTNAHLKCSPRLRTRTNLWLCGTWYSAVFKVEQLRTLFVPKNIRSRVAMHISGSWNSVCIFLNTNVFYVLLNVYAFGSFICFGLIGFLFHMGSILRSIYAELTECSVCFHFFYGCHIIITDGLASSQFTSLHLKES